LPVCDDARQFKLVTEELGLCWIHNGRHFKKSGALRGLPWPRWRIRFSSGRKI
jgi:hypothetical protein